ncbi:MAG: hypothetical protein GXX96_27705 [Planctomycetaceae bacterium]|nr:hypothetical protein [Planctomycetaceae bacterium]
MACADMAAAATLKPASIELFCITPNQPAVLAFHVEAGGLNARVDVVVRDYAGRVVPTANVNVSDDGLLRLSLQLEPGFYEIEFPAAEQQFGVICQPAFEGDRDPFFAIDSAMSWLVHDDATREGLVKVLARSGVPMSRERLNWGEVNPDVDRWDWESSRRYETLRQVCQREDIEVLEMFHGTTRWAGAVGKYPEDLVGTARAWRQIARRLGPTWGAMEVWNEPDISFGDNLPADQYVALVKTFAYAFQQEKVATPLVGGVFAHFNRQYLDNAARNGLLDQVPIVSFHTYGRAPGMEELIGRYRQWLVDYGRPSMPLWLTECGRPWKRGPQRPPADQDAESALDIVMKGVESKACGIDRYFPFVYPYYEERESNFGMMGREATPLRSMASYVQLVTALSHKRYLGDLKCEDAKIQRARVFGNGKEVLVVLCTGSPDTDATIRFDLPVQAIAGIDGRQLAAREDGSIPIPDGLVYVRLERKQLGERLQTDTQAMQLLAYSEQVKGEPQTASPVVLRYQFDADLVEARSEAYRLLAETPGKMSFAFRAYNLSSEPQKRTLVLSFSQPVVLEAEAAQSVTIPASGFADVRWDVDLSGAFAATGMLCATVRTQGADAAEGESVEIDLKGNPSLDQVLGRYPVQRRLPIGDLSAWANNITGSGKMTMRVSEDGGWRLNCQFRGGDRWVYPHLRLAGDVAVERYSAIVLRAKCAREAAVRLFLWEGDTGVGYISPVVIPADGKWHTAVVPFEDLTVSGANRPDPNHRLDRDQVRRISIGMNSESDENTLDVSDVFFVAEN